jgi:hypothetical protein
MQAVWHFIRGNLLFITSSGTLSGSVSSSRQLVHFRSDSLCERASDSKAFDQHRR